MARRAPPDPSRPRDAAPEPVDDPTALTPRRVALGCGLTLLAALLVVGLFGLAFGAWQRFVRPALEASAAGTPAGATDSASSSSAQGTAGAGVGPAPVVDPMGDLRRRYLPGPHVHVEGMIPSPRAAGATPGPGSAAWSGGRVAGTPWIVFGASFDPGAPPAPAAADAPSVRHAPGEPVDRPLDVVAGAPSSAEVRAHDAAGGTGVVRYLVWFDGYAGHFSLPTRVMTELGAVAAAGSDGAVLRFSLGAALLPDEARRARRVPFRAFVRIAAVDTEGRASRPVVRELSVLPVGTGDVEVTLTMSQPTDLDLYVSDPARDTVSIGHTTGFSGGHLDLDANAACAGNVGVNSEHVFWPAGRAPAGVYTVRVAHFERCVPDVPIDYRVTVRACGETVVLTGRFVGAGLSTPCLGAPGDPAHCQDVVTFSTPACPP